MANALYRKQGDGTWTNQGAGGGPVLMAVTTYPMGPASPFTYLLKWATDVIYVVVPPTALQTQAQAQAALDTYAAALNAGTA